MTDLAVLAAGFGAIPLASILLYSFRAWLDAHREVVWGGFAGVIAFLGLSHAMAFVLEGKPFLFAGNDSLGAASFLLTGLALGGLLGWFLFEGPLIRTEPASIVWATAAFLALHSFGDGLVLGRDVVGASLPVVRMDSHSTDSGVAVPREGSRRAKSATSKPKANVAVPSARWIVTMTQLRALVIVNAPSPTWATRIPKATVERRTRRSSARYHRRARTMVRRMERLVTAATRRWAYSTATSGSPRFGTMEPLHSGQSVQASPASIPRTVPPRTIVA